MMPGTDHNNTGNEINLSWIRFLYGSTAFVGITVGAIMLIAPDFSRKVVGFPFRLPVEDPIVYGALGSIWTAVGILCLFGLRAPMKFLALFVVQLIYKSLWLLFVFVPLMIAGEFPNYGWAFVIGNLTWIMMDIKATPWRYLFAKDELAESSSDADTTTQPSLA